MVCFDVIDYDTHQVELDNFIFIRNIDLDQVKVFGRCNTA
jgi:hypothetical protein